MNRPSLLERRLNARRPSEQSERLSLVPRNKRSHHDQERIPLQPRHLVKETLKLIRATLPAFIDIRENVAKDTGVVEADPNQLHQVLMNLCTNAAQGVGQKSALLTVTLENLEEASEETGEPGPIPVGTERVLFVDDEETLADIGKRMLESLGYEVEIFTSSPEALALLQEDPDRFDLVITDLTMPELTGEELTQKILEIRPDTPVILCTGHPTYMEKERAITVDIRGFLGKPLVSRDLALKVREVLDG